MPDSVSTTPPAPSRQQWFILLAVLVGGLVLRILLWSFQNGISVEGAETVFTARSMGSGLPWEHPHPIGFALLVRCLDAFGMSPLGAARVLDLGAGLAVMVLTWMVVSRWAQGWWIQILPVVAVAFLPLTVRYSVGSHPDMVYLALVLGAVAGAQKGRFLLAGVLIGYAAQIRPEAWIIAVGMLWVVRSARGLTPLLVGALVSFGVVWMFQGVLLQVWSPFPQVVQEAGNHWMDRDGYAVEALSVAERLGALVRNTLSFGGLWVPVLALLALSGPAPLVVVALLPILISPLIHLGGHPRFVLAFLPFLWILASVVIARFKPMMQIVLVILCVGGFALSGYIHAPGAYTIQEDAPYPELHLAGHWLKQNVHSESVVTGDLPHAALYAETRYRPLPRGAADYNQAVDAIVDSGADFVVFHQFALARVGSLLTPLVEDKPIVWHEDRLEPVYFNNAYMNGRTLVYRIVRPGGPAPLPSEGTDMRRQIGTIPHGRNHEFHGQVAMQAKKFDTAAGEYFLASNRNPDTPESAYALNNRAWCLLQAGDYDAAKGEAHRAIEILPHHEEFIDTMIEIVSAMGQDRTVTYWQGKLAAAQAHNAGTAPSEETP